MIAQNPEKVKAIVHRLVLRAKSWSSVPERKFMLEMVMGMLATGSCNLTRIAAALLEPIEVKHTQKRLQRMLGREKIWAMANALSLREAAGKVTGETVLALDDGDLAHQYGRRFEHQAQVRDGSGEETQPGYWLNQVSGYNDSTGETFPVLLDMFSTQAQGFVSHNREALQAIDRVNGVVKGKGLWVADRNYDNGTVLGHLLKSGVRFVVRMKETRNLWVKGRAVNIRAAAEGVNRRVKFDDRARFGTLKATLRLGYEEYAVTLIVFKDRRNADFMMLLTSGWEKSTKELKKRIRGYFRRWGAEECYRFEKQGFGIEKATVRRYRSIRTLLGLTLLAWLALIKINENKRLRQMVNKAAKMEKTKRRHEPKFIYYRLLQGVKNMLAGVRRLFLFRWKRRERRALLESIMPLLPCFPNPNSSRFLLEYGI